MENPAIPDSLAAVIKEATKIAVLTGAGISAESGIPTFREAQTGLWAQYDPEELATPEAFSRNPELIWQWYDWRRRLIADSTPNSGHTSLAHWQKQVEYLQLITQNVDGLHQRAGSDQIIELHGNLHRARCIRNDSELWLDAAAQPSPPTCSKCGELMRPDVVWFGESLPPAALELAWSAATSCDLFLSIGTSALVQPAASLPLTAKQAGAVVVEINPQATAITARLDYHLAGAAGEILPGLVELL